MRNRLELNTAKNIFWNCAHTVNTVHIGRVQTHDFLHKIF